MTKAKEIISTKVIIEDVTVVYNGLYEAKKFKGRGIAKYSLTIGVTSKKARESISKAIGVISEGWSNLQKATFTEAKFKPLSENSAGYAPLAVGYKTISLNSIKPPKVTDISSGTLNPKIHSNDIINVLASFTYYPEQAGVTVGFNVHAVNLVKKNSTSILDSVVVDSDTDWLAVNNVSASGYSSCVDKESESEVKEVEGSKKVSKEFWGSTEEDTSDEKKGKIVLPEANKKAIIDAWA